METSNKEKDWVLPNGATFLAISHSIMGSWAKDLDPVTAARRAYKDSGIPLIQVWYGQADKIGVGDFGGLSYETPIGVGPVPIGLFKLTSRSIRPAEKKDFDCDPKHSTDHKLWIKEQLKWLAKNEEVADSEK